MTRINNRCGILLLSLVSVCLGCITTPDRGDEGSAPYANTPCVFPFVYKEESFDECTNKDDAGGKLWCSTQVDARGKHQKGNWGYCSTGCPGLDEVEEDEFDLEVNTLEENDVSLRSSNLYGRACFSSSGYSGTCRDSKYCKGTDYSYSRTCGFSYVCCKKAPNPRSTINTRTTTRSTSRTTTRRPTTPPPPPPESLCGLQGTQPFVFGGQEAKPGQFPFMVSFVYTDGRKLENFCGGVLITNRHILTAGHCFYQRPSSEWTSGLVDVRIGLNDIQETEKRGSSANLERVTIHPNYIEVAGGKEGVRNDIAIVTLDRDVESPHVCLHELNRKKNSKAVVLGFGKVTSSRKTGKQQDKLRFAYLEEFNMRECQTKYNDFYRRSKHIPTITDEMLCAGNNEADACSGDSGSPLLYLNSDFRWMVAGVVSFGPSSCGNKAPGVYAKVEKYISWIKRETGL